MDRRWFLRAAGGTGVVGAAGAAGWALHEPPPLPDEAKRDERNDASGLPTGGAGAFGIHRVIYSVPVAEPFVALTFDDGPDPQFTPRVLEILAGYDIKATFNVMGYNAMHHDDILKGLVAAGHEVGNHTWTHLDLSKVDATETAYEIRRGREVIEDLTKLKIRFFRPPRGEMSGAAVRLVAEEGNDILMWSITGSVPGREAPAEVNSFVLDHLEPGAIIDFHDGIGRGTFAPNAPWARDLVERRTAEVEGLPKLIETAMAKGYRFMRVSDLLDHEVPGKTPSKTSDESEDADEGTPDITNPPDATDPKGNS
ncbi:MAG: polysaccharide deacetylase family protein [Acidimicrobiales bacterium]